jgi:hypothetical protein
MLHNLSFDSHKLVYFIILSFSVFHKPCTQNTHLGRLKLKLTLVIKPLSFHETQKKLLQKDIHIWADIHNNAESITITMSTNVMGTNSVPVIQEFSVQTI